MLNYSTNYYSSEESLQKLSLAELKDLSQTRKQTNPIIIFYLQIDSTDLTIILRKFWELEGAGSPEISLTPYEQIREEHFSATTKRLDNGIFYVSLP